ncbi:hypothetical protein F939_02289 [Acinetobacter radioresistens DSM 6976 = NBRC 102413 = CIP 103788]|uniref:hypothetical protein n=1 Tax=Acinetobacter TaxID=469 RepID=UPI00028DF57C|nr:MULTISPECIES: hypothetical protein [Acinetobacter]ENV87505.1 hypothetical protein F939_02289 [Acinetobacter radioresistens DSM 6976 = NBRC 102413 = CIP 103788]BBL21138.1 hypothetical protein ACRAD_18090 [Acinetobacter radioresistens DSM 6976 = NBRC 102413 = CIP 103788]
MTGNRWHATQDNNMRPDVAFKPCPWCGSNSICVDTTKEEGEHLSTWSAQASCHECGSMSPDTDFAGWRRSHPLFDEWVCLDWEIERDVVNLAVKVWNSRE